MKDFILAALPFIITGISIIIITVNSKKNKENYIPEGMCIGMSFGLMFSNLFNSNYMGLSLSIGMLLGEVIGSFIKKQSK